MSEPDNSIGFGVTRMTYTEKQCKEAFETLKFCKNDKFEAIRNILWAETGSFGPSLCDTVSLMSELLTEFPNESFEAAFAIWQERLSKQPMHTHDQITVNPT